MPQRKKLIILIFFLAFSACLKDKASTEFICEFNEVTFTKNILPITSANCVGSGCHDGSSYIGNFSKFEDVKLRADNGKLYKMVIELRLMPPGKTLPETDIDLISCWIEKEAPE